MEPEMLVPPPQVSIGGVESSKTLFPPPKVVVLADLNVYPPESDDHDSLLLPAPDLTRLTNDESSQDKSTLVSKDIDAVEGAVKKLNKKCLKTGLVHVARKNPKNAHAHFILGLMYQRLGQPQKAISAYEKAAEILHRSEAEIARPELLSLVQIHHAQCLLLENSVDNVLDKELEHEELNEILSKLKESMQSDIRQAGVWNTLGLILLKTGRLQSAIAVLSSLLALAPDNYDCVGNLGIAYLQSGNLELSAKYLQDLIIKDQNHPAALMNYAVILLCKYGSVVAGAGANASEGASRDQFPAINVAKECLLAVVKSDLKAAHTWANLANAYYLIGDHSSSSKCLEKVTRSSEQLSWAGNEMASVLREGDAVPIEPTVAWAGLAMVHKAQHEIVAAFETEQNELVEVEERAIFSLKQATAEDPDDAVQWNQLGLHSLCSQHFKTAQKSLQAECVYKRALSLASAEQAHAIFSNLGNLYDNKSNMNAPRQCLRSRLNSSLDMLRLLIISVSCLSPRVNGKKQSSALTKRFSRIHCLMRPYPT
ncbi:S-adenosyl-L-methionine-dependent methyltransferases superfamily protein isoform 1 [Hibiscus syriacus]|uniref:S-adenosyl-L-methionine-dependent methyltransferases superfamily protein isoform 1 n=1 Tax=Hibiscus syriacus TaxID=106335 RepID=A0A6A3AUQ6_HIBSY|nr:S-adenosyl-L-methionine-dependent methyltransferases superfamily protein isoform 1 [Hibiscus syriacus]